MRPSSWQVKIPCLLLSTLISNEYHTQQLHAFCLAFVACCAFSCADALVWIHILFRFGWHFAHRLKSLWCIACETKVSFCIFCRCAFVLVYMSWFAFGANILFSNNLFSLSCLFVKLKCVCEYPWCSIGVALKLLWIERKYSNCVLYWPGFGLPNPTVMKGTRNM